MNQGYKRIAFALTISLFVSAFCAPTPAFAAASEQVLYSFCSYTGCDGYQPVAPLVMDAAGNLYGTAAFGGTYNNGVVFELSPSGGTWTYTVLHYFGSSENDGGSPLGGLIFDANGNLYGTTSVGGANGPGTVFEMTPNGDGTWTETVLYSFNGTDGNYPQAGVGFDTNGNLYGTTTYGGTNSTACNNGCGVVFQLQPGSNGTWTEKVLHNFNRNGKDGWWPRGGVILDASGNVYGTTIYGGTPDYGTVFELSPATGGKWTYKLIHEFSSTNGGPYAPVVLDSSGNLYGVTDYVFELSPGASGHWTYKAIASLNTIGGIGAYGGLTFNSKGNLYGTTTESVGGDGLVFEVANLGSGKWQGRVIHNFEYDGNNGDYDGSEPWAGVIFDSKGNMYGVTAEGGTNNSGTVFEISP